MIPVLQINNLSKQYGTKTVVDNLSFNIMPGEIFGLIGPNGAGKSTTLKMICGLAKPTNGHVFVCGKNISTEYVKAVSNLGAVIEIPQMYNYLSGIANLKMYASFYGKPALKRIDNVLKAVGMENRCNDKFGTFSLGMKQRIGIAQALINQPKLLILDEPTNGLDPTGIIELRNLLLRLAKKNNIGILISSHNLSELEKICDKVAIINRGKLVDKKSMNEVSDMVKQNQKLMIKVDYPNYAGKLLIEKYGYSVDVVGSSIVTPISEELLAETLSFLLKNNLTIYGVEKMHKTLEELYMEIIMNTSSSTSVF